MTDYHAAASWDGVAERRGYVVVVDISSESSLLKRSGGWRTTKRVRGDDCAHCGASGKEPNGWVLEEAKANPREFNRSWAREVEALLPDVVNPRLFDSKGDQKCTRCNGRGHAWKVENVILPWPDFQGNLARKLWHVEKDERILESGIGLGPCADWDRERAMAAVERIVNRIEAAVARCEGTTATATVDRQNPVGGVTIRRNLERQGIEVVFPAKPAEEIRTALKRLGFRWSRRQGLWYARFGPSLWSQVHDLLGVSDTGKSASGPDQEDSEPDETPKPVLDETEAYSTASPPGSAPDHTGIDAPPWTMSRLAYQESRALCAGGVPILNAKDGRDHEAAVRQATTEGLPVPAHVLAEYGLAEETRVSGRPSPPEVETLQLALFTAS